MSMKSVGFLLLLIGSVTLSQAQDLIVLRSDDEIISRVTEIQRWYVYYKPFNQVGGQQVKLAKSDIAYILYEDGMKQFFSASELPPVVEQNGVILPDSLVDANLYYLGREHAAEYYQKRAPFWGTFGATVFYPFAGIFTGLVTGVVVGAIPPSVGLEDVPDPALYQANQSYAQGFQEQAHKNKVKEVAKGFGLGVALQATFVIILLASGF